MTRLVTVVPPGESGSRREHVARWRLGKLGPDTGPGSHRQCLGPPVSWWGAGVVGAEDAEAASSQAFSQIRPTSSPFPAAKGAPAAALASRLSTPSPRSRWGSRQFSYPFSACCFGQPGPEVKEKSKPQTNAGTAPSLPAAPVDARAVIFPFSISICHRNKAARRLAGREKRAAAKG